VYKGCFCGTIFICYSAFIIMQGFTKMQYIKDAELPNADILVVDAGVERLRAFGVTKGGVIVNHWTLPSSEGFSSKGFPDPEKMLLPVYITGKLSELAHVYWKNGKQLPALAVKWFAASMHATEHSVGLLELSASGYTLLGVEPNGKLKDDLMVTHPRCGAGVGFNIDRVLLKLGLRRELVDSLLFEYLGATGAKLRGELPIRVDRCGVFASSATISDKNQGIPLPYALAVTLKSEVIKACCHLKKPIDSVWLTGGVFNWKFCRDCAEDYLRSIGVEHIQHDCDEMLMVQGVLHLLEKGDISPRVKEADDAEVLTQHHYPSFNALRRQLENDHRFLRLQVDNVPDGIAEFEPLLLAIDAGSTMAKVIVASAEGSRVLYKGCFNNSCDTLETIKTVFVSLQQQGGSILRVLAVGLTGSARYQIRQALVDSYPELEERIVVLVENYAHARGSVELAREHLIRLRQAGVKGVEQNTCLVVDVGGEDTKISSIDLCKGDLLDNAMNSKCSAGTGSLLDSLASLFQIPTIQTAAEMAMQAPQAYALNATCAVFMLEDARFLQAEGRSQPEILASAIWAVVENMSRTLWKQIPIPHHAMVLLHGQTMQSDPFPLAVADRLQHLCAGSAYCLVPPDPGYRACFGLIETMALENWENPVSLHLQRFTNKIFEKSIVHCHGVACGDPEAHCSRTRLSSKDANGERVHFLLGGCSAINERSGSAARKKERLSRDLFGEIWKFISDRLPTSSDKNRLVIPRSFAVSEWGLFFAELFLPSGIAVHMDNVVEEDIQRGRAHFQIDTCAPHIGAVGQMLRLAEQEHGIILAPQIEFLPFHGNSLGRTCTLNQGGLAVAMGIAKNIAPGCRIHLFYVDLKMQDLEMLAHKLYGKMQEVYLYYGVHLDFHEFRERVRQGMDACGKLRSEAADFAAAGARDLLDSGNDIALVLGREYILNPGVYDSHVGRLLRDKGLAGIPAYLLDVEYDPAYNYIYWRNAHQIATVAAAAAKGAVYRVVRHSGLKELLREREEEGNRVLPLVQVSTFLCGPDSVTNPLVEELVKQRPYLRIQSDAAIKELAHLENRINTYVRQLADTGRVCFSDGGEQFDVEFLNSFDHQGAPNPVTDVIAFPTLSDNRALVSVLRGAGFTCIDNYSKNYRLTAAIARGRAVTGDSVCAPMAAVYGDVLSLIELFRKYRVSDPEYTGKQRLLIFNNKGLGPCRQGQYVEIHKLFLHQDVMKNHERCREDDDIVRFLVSHENKGFNAAFPQWVFLRGIQSVVLQGVLHQLWADGIARCSSLADVQLFQVAFETLKGELNGVLQLMAPTTRAKRWLSIFGSVQVIGTVVKFFAYGFHKNLLVPKLREFRRLWCSKPKPENPIRIHIDGEVYMRAAQFEELHREIVRFTGVGRVEITYTPVWSFLSYKLAGMMMRSREAIQESRDEIARSSEPSFQQQRRDFLRIQQNRLYSIAGVEKVLRYILAAPLYGAAGLNMPEPMSNILEKAKLVVPTRRPGGELMPFIGEAVLKLEKEYDLIINVAPEGCMVSSMGEALGSSIMQACPEAKGKVLPLFSQQGDIQFEQLEQVLLRALGPEILIRGY
jgi:activator of 2-hydroxyglutaryl-CoA dehydratase/predicted nucleotide-binding protein (sugar kinase/HSP70/actin superfamily)